MLRTLLSTWPPESQNLLGDSTDRRPHNPNRREDRDDRDDRSQFREEDDFDVQTGDHRIQARPLHLDFPHFNGDIPSGWSYKVNQFFDYYQTPLYQCVRMTSFHIESEALVWFQDADEAG
jgi:hypothetical protein